jgi:hypothetical protein
MKVSELTPSASAGDGNARSSGTVSVTDAGLRIEAFWSSKTLLEFVRSGYVGPDPVRELEDLCVIGVLSLRAGPGQGGLAA